MADKKDQHENQPPAPKLEGFWDMDTEMPLFSETIRDWLPDWLSWRKKKRKRD
ncbi:MAG: hypothetical protein AB7V58_13500 [Solirubrobacterales bacterium]